MKVLLVPLDDRPCCLQFVERLAEMAGVQLVTPPRALLGRFLQPGQPAALREWYAEASSSCDLAIVSLDMLAFGGLVASRNLSTPFDSALAELEAFARLDGPPVLASQSIMRTAPTQTSADEVGWAEAILALSQASTGIQSERLASRLPPERLAAYRRARNRNHQLNRWAIQQVEGGRWTGLLLGIDDSKTRGWNIGEIAELQGLTTGLPVWITPGTDESTQLLLARACAHQRQIQLVWSSPQLPELVGAYEDRPLQALTEAQMQAAGLESVPASASQLFIHGRTGPQAEARDQTAGPVNGEWLTQLRGAERAVVADVAYANGGDLSLLEQSRGLDLLGYSGWNTAGNTIGTALACLSLAREAAPARSFLLERLGDDGLYQARHRQRLQHQLGHAGLQLSSAELTRAQHYLNGPFLADWREWAGPGVGLTAELPWERCFEVGLTAS